MWKTKLGRCIYTSSSGYKVFQNPLYRWLTLGSTALQTVINRRYPQNPILYYLPSLTLMARHYPDNVCLLGLGGAGIPSMLQAITPNQSITSVEYSAEVIHIAQNYFMADQIPNLKIIHDNACNFVQQQTMPYKHLIVDLYDANNYPKECSSEDFFKHCMNCITEDGFLAVNLANVKEQWAIVQTIKTQFKTTVVIPVQGCANLVLIASKNNNHELLIQQMKKTGEIKRIFWDKNWGSVAEY